MPKKKTSTTKVWEPKPKKLPKKEQPHPHIRTYNDPENPTESWEPGRRG